MRKRNTSAFSTSESRSRCVTNLFLLGLAKLPDHGLDFASDALVRQVGGRRLIDEAGVHQRLIALRERTQSRDQVAVRKRTTVEGTLGAGALGQREAESEDQFLAFVEKLLGNLNLGKQEPRDPAVSSGQLVSVRCRVLPRLLQIRTVARAVERHLALLATALRTDLPVHGRAKPLFFSFFTDRATQVQFLGFDYFTERASQRLHHREHRGHGGTDFPVFLCARRSSRASSLRNAGRS